MRWRKLSTTKDWSGRRWKFKTLDTVALSTPFLSAKLMFGTRALEVKAGNNTFVFSALEVVGPPDAIIILSIVQSVMLRMTLREE